MKFILSLFTIGVLFCGCHQAEAEAAIEHNAEAIRIPTTKSDKETYDSAAEEVVQNAPNLSSSKEKIDQKIIKTGNLRFETSNMEETAFALQKLIKKYHATIQNNTEEKIDYTINHYFTIRLPNQNFDSFIQELSNGVDYFDTKNISIEDVTEEYIDVTSRIKTKKALEQRYLELLKKANKVTEMLEIEHQLATVREEIEAKEGRLKYLQNKVSMSTINIEFYKVIERKVGAQNSFGTKFVNALKSGFNGISTFFLWVIEVWPFIIILVALIFFIRKRIKKKNTRTNVDTN
jgi:hypothetical protein